MITASEIRERVLGIDDIADDCAMARREEDRLRHEVLEAIAAGAPNARELAREVLKSGELVFDRHYSFGAE